MHPQAFAWVASQVREHGPFFDVVEFGSRDINGSIRCLFADSSYIGIDIAPGPGVDHVGNAADYRTRVGHDCVVCVEVLEHTPDAERLVAAAYDVLRPNGTLIVTAATDPRAPHSGTDGGQVAAGEYYRNVNPADLKGWLSRFDDVRIEVHEDRGDVYAVARRPAG